MATDSTNGKKQTFTPFSLGALTLRNRVIRSAAFEGMSQGGRPTQALIDYHRQIAAGGVGMTTVAYASVSSDGRTYDHQLLLRPEIVPELRRLTDAIHGEGASAALQIGHSGYFSAPAVIGCRPIGPSVVYNSYTLTFPRAMTEADMARLVGDFGRGAALAIEGGFDALELQACHGYLLSQFLSPYTNRRKDGFGGSLDNRLRFPLDVLRRVREVAGKVPVMIKMNLRDGFEGGMELDEAVEVARRFEAAGADALILSGGFVSKAPMYVMRGEVPFKEFYAGQTSLTKKIGLLLVGRIMVKAFPFREHYFLDDARAVRRAVKLPLVLIGGVRTLQGMEDAIGKEGFELLSMARPLILEPDLLRKMERGESIASLCEPCNKCIAVMDKGGVYCPVADTLLSAAR
jgi:2,4-dienoyl-CoA reductase-like NADH-dependent reductase (Old Yellow Enzyme family)